MNLEFTGQLGLPVCLCQALGLQKMLSQPAFVWVLNHLPNLGSISFCFCFCYCLKVSPKAPPAENSHCE